MGRETKIDWTDHTWNPWQGCRKVSPGCVNCYMFMDKKRYGQDPLRVVRSKTVFNAPRKWKEPARVFVCSWSDFFIADADSWRDEAWQIIRDNPHLTFQLLTKRPENIKDRLPDDWPLQNVWLGVTAENQEMADTRLPILQEIQAPVRFVSVEPMLGPVTLSGYDLDWIICGGESGPKARDMDPDWALSLKDESLENGVAFFMKQMARKKPIPDFLKLRQFPTESKTRGAAIAET